jgi:hypothetical protein
LESLNHLTVPVAIEKHLLTLVFRTGRKVFASGTRPWFARTSVPVAAPISS